jgi:hypothetical protein
MLSLHNAFAFDFDTDADADFDIFTSSSRVLFIGKTQHASTRVRYTRDVLGNVSAAADDAQTPTP